MIVSCGEALIDMVPEPVPGGGPMNVAIAAARLGAPAAFVGGLSTDAFGDLLYRHLVDNGVDASWCTRHDAPTALAVIEHDPVMRFRFEGDGTADTLFDRIPDLGETGRNILHGGTLGMFRGITADTLADLAASHRVAGGIVSLDSNVRPQIIDDRARWHHYHERWLPHVDLYKGSDEDFDWTWPGRTAESCAEELLASGTMSAVIVTRGGDGLSVITPVGDATATAPDIDVVDTVGAGDTIVGAVLTQVHEIGVVPWQRGEVLDSWHLDRITLDAWAVIAQNSVDAAAITCARAGAGVPFRHELDW